MGSFRVPPQSYQHRLGVDIMRTQGLARAVLIVIVGTGCVTDASAQTARTTAPSNNEDIEPRNIGRPGVTLLGVSGAMSRFFSSEQLMAGTYTVQVDAHRFVFSNVAIRFGVVGTDVFGVDADDGGAGAAAVGLEALGGALYYFTPESIWSFYGGGEYRARLTRRVSGDAGAVAGIAGLQGALSARASFFVEGGYGLRLRRGDENDLQTRIVGQAGVRFRF